MMPKAADAIEAVAPHEYAFLRRAFEYAEKALAAGERPFGAVVVDRDGVVLSEAHGHGIGRGDPTAHAETTAIRSLPRDVSPERLAAATLYSSVEPCAMCAGAIYWSNIRRVVFGVSEERLRPIRDVGEHRPVLRIKCAAVLATGGYPIEVIGPVLEDEGLGPHLRFWSRPLTRPKPE